MPRSRVLSRRAASAGLLVAGSFVILNGLSFVFSVLAARALGPAQYGVLASMMNLLLIVNVVAMGLQAVAARRIAVEPVRQESTALVVRRTAWWAGAGVAVGVAVLAPLLDRWLRLGSLGLVGLLALSACALAVLGGRLGTLQGTEHWRGFAVTYVVFGLTRLACGWLGVVLRPDPVGAFAGVTVGLVLTMVAGVLFDRRAVAVPDHQPPPSGRATKSFLIESGHAMTLLLAFFALSSIDVLLARAVLDEHDAGLYASGQILAKSVLFLPSFVSVVAFPRLARGGRDRLHLLGLAVVLGMGAVGVAMTALLPALALVFVGGAQYAQTSNRLWEFAALGAVLAGIQLLVTTALARRHTRAVWVLWLAVAVLTGAALLATTWDALLHIVLGVDLVVLAALVLVTRKDHITGQDLQT
ncbi:MAG: oligosaccharide flippase family protein [Phycicoccus sp.]|nr:oligosaccharide flippase family protein [Phycicoccus sp.]